MKIIFTLLMLVCGFVQAQQITPIPPASAYPNSMYSPYCLPAAASAIAGYFIPTASIQPVSSPSSTLEFTDGAFYYVITMTAGTGLITSLPSCAIRYTTKQ